MSTKANGKTIRLMATEYTTTLMDPSTKDSGRMTSSTAKALKFGQMAQNMLANTPMVTRRERDSFLGPMDPAIMANLLTMIFMEKACISGPTSENMMDSGLEIECTAMASFRGLTIGPTKANTRMTRRMVLGLSNGQMVENTKASGKVESNMALG